MRQQPWWSAIGQLFQQFCPVVARKKVMDRWRNENFSTRKTNRTERNKGNECSSRTRQRYELNRLAIRYTNLFTCLWSIQKSVGVSPRILELSGRLARFIAALLRSFPRPRESQPKVLMLHFFSTQFLCFLQHSIVRFSQTEFNHLND